MVDATPVDPKAAADKLVKEQQESLKSKEKMDKEMQEALRIAHEADKAEEEEFMRKAIEESKALED